jgi:hypothetical protein
VKVWQLKAILNSFFDEDQVLAFKFVVKRDHSTHTEQSVNWPRLDPVESRPQNAVVISTTSINISSTKRSKQRIVR